MTARAFPPDFLVGAVADLIRRYVILRGQPFLDQFGEMLGEAVGQRSAPPLTKGATEGEGVIPNGPCNKLNRSLENMVATFRALEPGPDGGALGEIFRTKAAVLFIEPHGGGFGASFGKALSANRGRFAHVFNVELDFH